MANDAGEISASGVLLPSLISKKFTGKTASYTPADSSEGWYFKMTHVTDSSTDLIMGPIISLKNSGVTVGSRPANAATDDEVKFLYIEHTGVDSLNSSAAESVYIVFDGSAVANDTTHAIEIKDGQAWFGKVRCTVGDLHAIVGVANAGGAASSQNVKLLVAAIIHDTSA